MGVVADFGRYKKLRDYDRKLNQLGWSPTRLESESVEGAVVYLYDDDSGLLLFSLIPHSTLEMIRQRVASDSPESLLTLAENLNTLITDFIQEPPREEDDRLPLMAETMAWFVGFSLASADGEHPTDQSIAVFRLLDREHGESSFHLARLDWPEVIERGRAESRLAAMARILRRSIMGSAKLTHLLLNPL